LSMKYRPSRGRRRCLWNDRSHANPCAYDTFATIRTKTRISDLTRSGTRPSFQTWKSPKQTEQQIIAPNVWSERSAPAGIRRTGCKSKHRETLVVQQFQFFCAQRCANDVFQWPSKIMNDIARVKIARSHWPIRVSGWLPSQKTIQCVVWTDFRNPSYSHSFVNDSRKQDERLEPEWSKRTIYSKFPDTAH
jgi:hypothetical protein